MPRLLKFCRQEHNPCLGATSLQLGTFAYYRALDPSFTIADPGEATHSIVFKEGTEITVDDQVSRQLFGGSVGASGGGLKMIAGSNSQFRVEVANAYIFCASRAGDFHSPSLDQAREYDPSYNSSWEITDARRFRDLVGSALLEVLTLGHLLPKERAAVSELPLKDLALQVRMLDRAVEYVDSRDHYVDGLESIAHVPAFHEALDRAVFRKDRRDETQQEHRFVFVVECPRLGVLGVNPEPVRIPLNRLADAVASVPLSA